MAKLFLWMLLQIAVDFGRMPNVAIMLHRVTLFAETNAFLISVNAMYIGSWYSKFEATAYVGEICLQRYLYFWIGLLLVRKSYGTSSKGRQKVLWNEGLFLSLLPLDFWHYAVIATRIIFVICESACVTSRSVISAFSVTLIWYWGRLINEVFLV